MPPFLIVFASNFVSLDCGDMLHTTEDVIVGALPNNDVALTTKSQRFRSNRPNGLLVTSCRFDA